MLHNVIYNLIFQNCILVVFWENYKCFYEIIPNLYVMELLHLINSDTYFKSKEI